MLQGIFSTKGLDNILAAAESREHSLKRTLGPVQVTLLGIGGIIGAGIFATVGEAAAGVGGVPGAGPSLVLSFVITAIVCGFTALCYAEFASMVPISGSAYTYAYATMGELIAWIIGWDLIIEYAVGNTAVAISWANYFHTLLSNLGIHFPEWLATDYRTAVLDPELMKTVPHILGIPIVFNLLAFGIVAVLTVILVWGIRESAGFNAVMVIVKLVVLAFFVVVALYYLKPGEMTSNWRPFQPKGWAGTFAGAAVVFFAYIGFDAVSTVAEETKRPSRDLPIGIIASLVICTVIYIAVAAVFTGMIPYPELVRQLASKKAEPLTMALEHVAPQATWASTIVAFGSVVAHTAVLLVFQLGQPRIFFSMARDGLLPPAFARVHPRFKTPHVTTILTGLAVGLVAAFTNISEMVALTNIGTLFAFILVCLGIPILRMKEPHRERPFKVPLGPWLLPLLGAISCAGLIYYLPPSSWWRFVGWLVLGMAVYASYGYAHSEVGAAGGRPRRATPPLALAAIGFLLLAAGLFAIPHDAPPGRLFELLRSGETEGHSRTAAGAAMMGIGIVAAIIGVVLQRQRGYPPATNSTRSAR